VEANADMPPSTRVAIIVSVSPGRGAFVPIDPDDTRTSRTGTQRGRGRVPLIEGRHL